MKSIKNKNILIVELGSESKIWILRRIASLGVNLYLAQSENYPGIKNIIPKNHIIWVNTYSIHHLISKVFAFLESNNITFDGVGTFFELAVPNASILAGVLSLPSIKPDVAFRTSNCKLSMRHMLSKFGIRDVAYKYVDKIPTNKEKININRPSVLKPIVGNNSYGAIYLDKRRGKLKNQSFINNTTQKAIEKVFSTADAGYLIEEYIQGTQITIDGYVFKDKIEIFGMTEVLYTPPPYFVPHTNYIPPRISKSDIESCSTYTKDIVNKLGINNSFFHCELRLSSPGNPKLIEIAGRLVGGKTIEGYEKAYSIDLIKANVALWLGIKPCLKKKASLHVIQSGLFPDRNGCVTEIKSIERMDGEKDIFCFDIITPVGEQVITFPEYPVPIIYFAIASESRQNAELLHQRVLNAVEFSILGCG